MDNAIKLLESILKNMEYIRLIITEGHKYIPPLNTFDETMRKLEKLRYMLDNEFLTPEQIRQAVIKLETLIKPDKDLIVEAENPVESGDPLE